MTTVGALGRGIFICAALCLVVLAALMLFAATPALKTARDSVIKRSGLSSSKAPKKSSSTSSSSGNNNHHDLYLSPQRRHKRQQGDIEALYGSGSPEDDLSILFGSDADEANGTDWFFGANSSFFGATRKKIKNKNRQQQGRKLLDPCINYKRGGSRRKFPTSVGYPCDLKPSLRWTPVDILAKIPGAPNNMTFGASGRSLAAVMLSVSMASLLRLYRNASRQLIMDPNQFSPVLCLVSLLHTQNCKPRRETFPDCIRRLGGPWNVDNIVPKMCFESRFWRWLKLDRTMVTLNLTRGVPDGHLSGGGGDFVNWRTLKRGVIPTSTVVSQPRERRGYVPPEQRTPFPSGGDPILCKRSGVVVHPISYGVPANTIVDKVPRTKAFDFMPHMPQKFMTGFDYKLGIREESIYRELYSQSFFSFSNRRGGFQVLRHLEILAAGSVPFMPDISTFPITTMHDFPKNLIEKVLHFPGVDHIPPVHNPHSVQPNNEWYGPNGDNFHFKKRGTIRNSRFNRTAYFELADELLAYTKKYLTCGAVVAGMLKRMKAERVNHVLISAMTIDLFQLWQGSSDSYMPNTLLQGFSELGINVTIAARDQLLWRYRIGKKTIDQMSEHERGQTLVDTPPGIYGSGLTYKGRAYNRDYDEKYTKEDTGLTKRILRREFDLVVFAFTENEMRSHAPFIEAVSMAYNRSEVAIVDHFDHHVIKFYEYPKLCDMATIFVRECDPNQVCIHDPNRPKPKVKCPRLDDVLNFSLVVEHG